MPFLQTLTSRITLLAVAANPFAAAAMPCNCEPEPKPTCCESAAEEVSDASPAEHACCARQAASEEYFRQTNCCCVESQPANVPARDHFFKSLSDRQTPDGSFGSSEITPRLTRSAHLKKSSDRYVLSGPPLLALYCVWLK